MHLWGAAASSMAFLIWFLPTNCFFVLPCHRTGPFACFDTTQTFGNLLHKQFPINATEGNLPPAVLGYISLAIVTQRFNQALDCTPKSKLNLDDLQSHACNQMLKDCQEGLHLFPILWVPSCRMSLVYSLWTNIPSRSLHDHNSDAPEMVSELMGTVKIPQGKKRGNSKNHKIWSRTWKAVPCHPPFNVYFPLYLV